MGATQHPPELRAEVTAALLAGQGVGAVAKTYELPRSTVSRWKQQAEITDDIGDLLLKYLRTGIATLTEQHTVFRDPEWLKGQPAGELAVLHGVLTDKVVRLLEAMEGGPNV